MGALGISVLVSLTTTQVETLFGEMEYIEQRLKALGVSNITITRYAVSPASARPRKLSLRR